MTASSESQSQSQSGIDNSILGAALVAAALVVLVATVIFIWLQVAPTAPLSFERYFHAIHLLVPSSRLLFIEFSSADFDKHLAGVCYFLYCRLPWKCLRHALR